MSSRVIKYLAISLAICAILRSIAMVIPYVIALHKLSVLEDIATTDLPDPSYFGNEDRKILQDMNDLVMKMRKLKSMVEEYSM